MTQRSSGAPQGRAQAPRQRTSRVGLPSNLVAGVQGRVGQAVRWTNREIILVFFAAFIAGLGAGAAQALISWALS